MKIRAATLEDSDRLLAWRNDPETRAASFTTDPVAREDHEAWLARKLPDPRCLLMVAEVQGMPVASARLDLEGVQAEISITVAPEARGNGLAAEVIRLALAEAAQRGVREARAQIKKNNERSLRMCERAGFTVVGESNGIIEMVTTIY